MHRYLKIIVWIAVILFSSIASDCSDAHAAPMEQLLQTAKKLNLSEQSTWRKLLHFEFNDKKSVVLSDEFFLSPTGRMDPQDELDATIKAYFQPWENDPGGHPRCLFPARYYWLSQHIALPGYQLREDRCANLERWALFDEITSISLFLVSGYLGNPASTFGHALLKLNTDSKDDQAGLFDLSLNYGAVLPDNEPVLLYIFRGLFGGYEAGFSDRYYYSKDLVYSRTEYRDIWDYRLNLTDYQRTLLILHIWEIVGKKFTYYFLDKNCAFRLAELVDLVIDDDLVQRDGFWYIPDNMFHRLDAIHRSRLESGQEGVIESITYIPSAQRKLYAHIKDLQGFEIQMINDILKGKMSSLAQSLSGLSQEQQISILDALLAYQQYQITSVGKDAAAPLQEDKQAVLIKRLALPTRDRKVGAIEDLKSPAEGSRPMETSVSYALDKDGESYVRLGWSPFKKESVGLNSLESDELVVLDGALAIYDNGTKVVLEQFDFIRLLNLNVMALPIDGEDQWSWKLRVGSNRAGTVDDSAYDGVVRFGVGPAKKLHQNFVGYALLDVSAHTLEPYVRLRPHVGLVVDFDDDCKAHFHVGVQTSDYDFDIKEIWGAQIQYHFTKRSALKVNVSNERLARYSIGLNYYW